MIARIYHSNNSILKFALEDIYKQFHHDFFMDVYDFIIFAINSEYPYDDIHYSIKKILKTNNYVAFNATDAFCNSDTVSGVVALFIKFENRGLIGTYFQHGFSDIEDCAQYLLKNKDDLHIILSTSSDALPSFLDQLNKKLKGNKISILGGVSSGNLSKDELVTYQYINNEIVKNGFMIISFKNVTFSNQISLGYKPIGPIYKVDKTGLNKVYKVEGNNASSIAKQLLKDMGNKDIRNLWYSPMVILDEADGMVDVVRTFKSYTDEYIEFFGPINDGEKIKLSFATEDMLIESDRQKASEIKEEMNYIELGFNFSCIARQYALGKRHKDETRLYAEIFNSPIFGFFTFGEIGMSKDFDSFKFYNQTSLICGMKEK